jgi:hypothetical protein
MESPNIPLWLDCDPGHVLVEQPPFKFLPEVYDKLFCLCLVDEL